MFERDELQGSEGSDSRFRSVLTVTTQLKSADFKLHCKLTDFGALQLPSGDFALGGSRPWQAPEIKRETAFKVEDAKRTDIYGKSLSHKPHAVQKLITIQSRLRNATMADYA